MEHGSPQYQMYTRRRRHLGQLPWLRCVTYLYPSLAMTSAPDNIYVDETYVDERTLVSIADVNIKNA